MSLKIPRINGVRPTPKTTKTPEEIERLIRAASEQEDYHNRRSEAIWDKWADETWKQPQPLRQYIRDEKGTIRRA